MSWKGLVAGLGVGFDWLSRCKQSTRTIPYFFRKSIENGETSIKS